VKQYDILEREIRTWAEQQDDVRALVVVGSRARTDRPADEWSDLDLMLFVTEPKRYATNTAWLSQFGEIWLHSYKMTGVGDPEWLVLYAGGFKVDFLLASATGNLTEMLFGSKYRFVTGRGVRVLVDRQEGANLGIIRKQKHLEWQKPDELLFSASINQFLLLAYRATNMLQRGELWRAKMIIDGELRLLLLRQLEWQARAVNGNEYDTWHDGRFLEEWADPQAKAKIPLTFAPYDEVETSRALLQLIELAIELGKETAGLWHYDYPATNAAHFRDWVEMVLM